MNKTIIILFYCAFLQLVSLTLHLYLTSVPYGVLSPPIVSSFHRVRSTSGGGVKGSGQYRSGKISMRKAARCAKYIWKNDFSSLALRFQGCTGRAFLLILSSGNLTKWKYVGIAQGMAPFNLSKPPFKRKSFFGGVGGLRIVERLFQSPATAKHPLPSSSPVQVPLV